MTTLAVEAGRVGHRALRVLRLTPQADWPAVLARAAIQGFDTVLCHGAVPPGLAAAAAKAGLSTLADLAIDRAGLDAPADIFAALPLPTLDPRQATALAAQRVATLTGPDSVVALAQFWANAIGRLGEAGIGGVRLLGLDAVPQELLPLFLETLRAGAADAMLFAWTPGLNWQVLAKLPRGTLDYVASSLPWWDGHGDWLWYELEALRRIGGVIVDAGERASPARQRLAVLLGDGWMTDTVEAGEYNRLRDAAVPGCPYTRLISPPGEPVIALEMTDQPDSRQAHRAGIAALNMGEHETTMPAANLLTRLGGSFGRFRDESGTALVPGTTLTLAPGECRVFAAEALPVPVESPVIKERAVEAAKQPRIALENPTPCVDGGRFPARRTVGTLVAIECDIIGDGHERFAAVVRYNGPGTGGWVEVPMQPLVNDRWVAEIPLERLGITSYTVEAWKDVWAYYVHELSSKHQAGVDTTLEIREGRELVARAAARSKGKTAALLKALLKGRDSDDAARETLLSPEAATLMAAADDRPHRVELAPIKLQAERTAAGFASWYEVFPRSMSDDPARHGTFRDVVRHLPRIRAMGFDVLYFPPIHPIGEKNRKGRNNTLTPTPDDPGSPYAIGSKAGGHTAIHPELGTLEDFEHLRMAAGQHGIELALDFAIQCSPDHPWLKQHPDWFTWRPDGTIRYAENPPKKYEDIVNVDFYAAGAVPGLWLSLCDVVMFWARNGVRLFRVDNPHTKAFPFWEWMISEVQARYPDTVFLAEAFTRPKVMYRLAKIGFSQSYTYFTWRSAKWEFQQYMTELTQGPPADFFRPHFFVNTPDINPLFLQTSGRPGFLIRAALAATLSGLWGVYNGFELCEGTPLVAGKEEYLDSEKYQIRAWDWERPGNIVAEIAQLNTLRKMNPALQTHLGITFLECPNDQILLFEKATEDRSNVVLVAISLDAFNTQSAPMSVPFWRYTPEPAALTATDLLTDSADRWMGTPAMGDAVAWPTLCNLAIEPHRMNDIITTEPEHGEATTPLPPIEDPLWYKDAIIYQLHIKSFFDANNDGVGDFRGLLEKLDYIAELGVSAVWTLPFYPSPRRDDGYDIAEYTGVHADYGDIEDVRRFIDAAHARGLRVITELVINHTSDQHPWFQRARQAPPGSPEREFYVWSDSDEKYSGTRIIFLDTESSNWTFDKVAGAYYWHRFYSHQPDLNFDNPLVLAEVMKVMRFWLDLGVDGLRLDAVPYLVEREGTNNENLPETHEILRLLRAELDRYAPGRMLLAEANQWPEDAQQYFGSGDECHMSFHFPLMPRMYMAIAREDRFPITDIMRQTPEIPANCQWAVFLRNHDELTLEMVSSSDRDYLWETYASDRRARINLGIRRRLAPLLEHDRRRIELMNGLLLSMPGTPVIYYGDEIGMGDNIFLGDRDGVRTPMQWSVDRNGGFSRADPAQLVLPPIMDPLYGYQAVNVEAQARDSHSLLNWTRRMLAVRKRHRAFGRGAQRFLYPFNRKVLAFVREWTNEEGHAETILCVSNISRTAQAVELDLSGFAGRVPVDIVGGAVFPPIGQLTYMVTLPPYGFYWFTLAEGAELPTWHIPPPEPLPEYTTLVMRAGAGLEEMLRTDGRLVLERDALRTYLPRRRWFASKGENLQNVRLAYAAMLPGAAGSVMFAEIEAQLAGRRERYVLPLGLAWDDETSAALVQQLALTRVRRGPRMGYLTDGFAMDALTRGMLDGMRDHSVVPIEGGELQFRATSRMTALVLGPDAEIRRLSAEQSNSSWIVGDAVVLKLVRRVLAGVHPEGEMTRELTERGFGNTSPLLGELVRVDTDGTPHTVGLAHGFIRNQGDGWGWTLEFLARQVEEAALIATPETAGAEAAEEDVFSGYQVFAANIGRRLGELHAVLSQPSDDLNFAPQAADHAVLEAWGAGAVEQIDAAMALLGRVTEWADETTRAQAQTLLDNADRLRDAARRLALETQGAWQTRVHGDFHLGQILVVQGDAFIIDFEGEPARTMLERRAKSSPLRDVAGLLRSFDYAAAAAAPGRVAASAQAAQRRHAGLLEWRTRASAAFLEAYRAVLDGADDKWVPAADGALLDLFLLEKAAYEIKYEATNRPSWLGIPVSGMYAIAQRLLGLGAAA